MRVVYIPCEDWDSLYNSQAAHSGHGISGFEGVAYQRGGGIGNFLGRLFRFVLPVAKKAMKSVGKQALATGADILSDAVQGRNIKEAAKEHGRAAAGNLLNKAGNFMRGNGRLGKRPKTIKGGRTVKRKRGKKLANFLQDVEIN
jgi:hypothetical protein